VRPAERIILLSGGRIAEDGGHDELMSLGGVYARLYRVQAARFATTGDPPGRPET
jgi:ATP-binding cassette subfamily B protein